MPEAQAVEEYLNDINYTDDPDYVPSQFALEFVTFIKLVNGEEGEEHKSPVVHYQMLDMISGTKQNICNMCSRGLAKTTLLGEYLFLYLAVYGKLPGFGEISLALYVSDSIENGVKNMRKNLEHRWENSDFLKHYVPKTRFTDVRWEFENVDGKKLIIKGYGAKTGVRGAKEMGIRPNLAVLDDLVSDEDARSATVIASIEDTVYKAIDYALHPTKSKTIWSGTPFNSKDPLYKAVESGAWYVNVYPVCEEFPVEEKDFKPAWGDRFNYTYVKKQYDKALKAGKIDTFNQELMLRIMSEEDRLIQDHEIKWYKHENVVNNKNLFNFYITTDFATSEKTSADYSVISVWAYNNNGDWFWVDGICKRQLMDANVNDLFRLAQEYNPQSVGIEVTGQQGGFIQWIQNEMMTRNIYFTLASENNSTKAGIRPNTNKMQRFNVVVPWFKLGKIFLPTEKKKDIAIQEAINELKLASASGFKSKHDDFCSSGDTLIKTYSNDDVITTKRFDQLVNGDIVEGYNEDTRLFEKIKVKGFIQTGIKQTFTVTDSVDSQIHLTDNHPVLTQRGWVLVKDLTLQDKIICKSKNTGISGLKRNLAIISLRLILKMEQGIGYIKKFI